MQVKQNSSFFSRERKEAEMNEERKRIELR